MAFPKQSDLEIPILQALSDLGESATPQDVYPRVAEFFPDLTAEDQELRMESSPSARKWWNLVQWARQRLVDAGEIDGSTRNLWKLTEEGEARLAGKSPSLQPNSAGQDVQISESSLRDIANQSRDETKSRLLSELKQLTPTGFERFCMELLQQLGYRNLSVTKRSGDGGIDGFGDFRTGAINIKSAFQAKRWADAPVGRPDIDKFRGAIQGEFDHGVFMTTSRFTKEAAEASHKKGAISILPLDGESITELMLERGIGVVKQPVYLFEMDPEFFEFDDVP